MFPLNLFAVIYGAPKLTNHQKQHGLPLPEHAIPDDDCRTCSVHVSRVTRRRLLWAMGTRGAETLCSIEFAL